MPLTFDDKENTMKSTWVLALVSAALLAACDTGPSEAEFLAVCLKEGQTAVNQAISKRMGIDRDKYCKCAAKEARTALSADGYRWMMLNMENKKTESRALAAKMNEAQQTELMAAALEVSAKCATGEVLGPVKKP
jgi:hypothetical protein